MSELRWDPVLEEWVITATHRMARPVVLNDPNACPLCPGVLEIPGDFNIVSFENRFPSLHAEPPKPDLDDDELYKVRDAKGICEVIVYSSKHDGSLAEQSLQDVYNLVQVWKDRYEELSKLDFIDYVFIFENKGKEIGVTMSHPHGQIYAFPYIPPKIQRELDSSRRYKEKNGKCLFCEILKKEKADSRRIITENERFTAFIPFFAHFPYEVHIYANNHLGSLADFDEDHQKDFARILKIVIMKYDNLFNISFPYMMIMHQEPTDGKDHSYYHFHLEFYPPYRSEGKLKFLAGCESGAGSFINDSAAEVKAKELRDKPPYSL
ncbi:TPA: galactose-1-phosphate uridylyltransferase [bacterium]|nr:galactose-1-phosphate uridylyltransferase [bacterium]